MASMMRGWVHQPGYPLVEVSVGKDSRVHFRQQRITSECVDAFFPVSTRARASLESTRGQKGGLEGQKCTNFLPGDVVISPPWLSRLCSARTSLLAGAAAADGTAPMLWEIPLTIRQEGRLHSFVLRTEGASWEGGIGVSLLLHQFFSCILSLSLSYLGHPLAQVPVSPSPAWMCFRLLYSILRKRLLRGPWTLRLLLGTVPRSRAVAGVSCKLPTHEDMPAHSRILTCKRQENTQTRAHANTHTRARAHTISLFLRLSTSFPLSL